MPDRPLQSGRLPIILGRASIAQSSFPTVSVCSTCAKVHVINISIVSRVPDEDIIRSLNAVVDETFSSPDDAELNALAKDILARLEKAYSIPTIIAILGEVEELNARGLESLGGTRFSVFSPSPGSSVAATPALSPAFNKMNLSLVDAKLSNQSASGTESPTYFSISALPTSYFSFNVIPNPERLSVTWPEEFGTDFLKATTKIAQALRNEKRDPSFVDYIVSALVPQRRHRRC